MQLQALLFCVVAALATAVVAMPTAGGDGAIVAGISARDLETRNLLETRKSCSGKREANEFCGGKKLRKQNSFHNW